MFCLHIVLQQAQCFIQILSYIYIMVAIICRYTFPQFCCKTFFKYHIWYRVDKSTVVYYSVC